MGSANPVNKELRIDIKTGSEFYNSGSSVEGVVYVEADRDFDFNALHIRLVGKSAIKKVKSGANGLKEVQKI